VLVDPKTHSISALNTRSIGPEINPAGFRVTYNDDIAGADIVASITGMPFGRGKLADIDFRFFHFVFEHRTISYLDGRYHRLDAPPLP
jgi:hypothetical protein